MLRDLHKHVRRAIRKHNVPGASVAVLRGKRITGSAAAGVVNVDTRVSVTTDTLFQIGSITKPFTATMIVQLRDEGALDLDDPILKHVPDLRNANMDRLQQVTIRHLLTHQSGIDGDFFPRTDSGNNAIAQLLEMGAMLPSLFEPGTNFSYCNMGFVALGRVIEIKDNRAYDDSLKARIFDPLGMKHALSRLEDNLRFRVAVGHVPDPRDPKKHVVPDYPFLNIGQKSAGSTPAMTAEDLLKFAAAHLHGGTGLNGVRLLRARSAAEMVRRQARPQGPTGGGIGLAWGLGKAGDQKIFAHDGGTVGQASQLIVVPGRNLAIAALTNGGNSQGFFNDIVWGLADSLARVRSSPPPEPRDNVRVRRDELVGVYENIGVRVEVVEEGDRLRARGGPKDNPALAQDAELEFVNPRYARIPVGVVQWSGPRGEKAAGVWVMGRFLPRVG